MGNASLAPLSRTETGDGLEEAFNSPRWIPNVGGLNPNLWLGIGFSVNDKHQSQYLWRSSLATGIVPVINDVDAPVSYRINPLKLSNKLGPPTCPIGLIRRLWPGRAWTAFTTSP